MNITEFREGLLEEVLVAAESDMNDVTSEFIKYVTDVLIDVEELQEFTECYFEGTGKRNRLMQIDGYCYDEVDKNFTVLISDFSNEKEQLILYSQDIERLYSRMEAFVINSINEYITENYEQSSSGYEVSLEIQELLDKIVKFRFYIISDKVITDRLKAIKGKEINGKNVELNIWDITRLYNISQANMSKESIEIDLTEYSNKGLQSILAVDCKKEEYKSYLTMIPGDVLADLYIKYGARLLEGNVRSFLSVRGKVNKQIRSTILNEPEMFFAYNNGIAATVTDLNCEIHNTGMYIKKLFNLQIINGGQTTASIANAVLQDKIDVSNISVPVKLSVVSNEKAEEIIPIISKCANSQNKVDEADFFSNHPYHIRIEEYSRKTFAPAVDGKQYQTIWFYERARGQHSQEQMKLTRGERKKYLLKNPKSQVIKKVDLAKYINTYKGYPNIVSKGAQYNMRHFAERIDEMWKKSESQFNSFYFKKVVSLAIIYKETEKIVTNQDWYKEIKSYRANIVTYSLAIIFSKIKKDFKDFNLDFKRIWNSQDIYIELKNQIIITTKEVFDYITRSDRVTLNVTEWCKKELCWTRAQKEMWTFNQEFLKTLVTKEELVEEKITETKKRRFEQNIDIEMKVMKLGAEYWRKMLLWSNERRLCSPMESDILKIASTFDKTGKAPSTKQSKILLDLKGRMELEGFK